MSAEIASGLVLAAALWAGVGARRAATVWRWLSRASAALAWLLLATTLIARGLAGRQWPLGTRFEFSLCFVWIMLTIQMLLESYWPDRRAHAGVLAAIWVVSISTVVVPGSARDVQPLPPVLRSAWLQGHVLTAMVAYGAFGVAMGLASAYLVGTLAPLSSAERAPQADRLAMADRLIALGFPWLTLAILTGAIWAQRSWGRYWGWDPKESWALITWLWYLWLLHVRTRSRWGGRAFAWLVLVGFGLVMFTFVGVPRLSDALQLDTLHGY